MKIPILNNIIEKIISRNQGASGLNQTRNSFKMAGYLLAPFIAGFMLAKIFLPPQYEDLATLLILVCWIGGIVLFYSNAKTKASSYLPFPQSHWFFPDGQQVSYDLMVEPNGYEELTEYSDGSRLYRVFFKSALAYQETDRPYPDIFDHVLLKTPDTWNETFKRNAEGEFFFENLFITHPACENVQITVIDWDERGSYRLPLCVVTGCSFYAKKALQNRSILMTELDYKKTIGVLAVQKAFITELKTKNNEVVRRNEFLEIENEDLTSNMPETIKELSDRRLENNLKRYGLISNAKKSRWTRILNLKNFIYGVILLAVLAVLGHFLVGFP